MGKQSILATSLDSPRGLAFGPDGYLYVAEAGRGGDTIGSGTTGDDPAAPAVQRSIIWPSSSGRRGFVR